MFHRLEFALATLLLAAIVGLVGIAAVTRVMGAPIIWSIEVASAMFFWLVVLAVDLAMRRDRHFGLSLLTDSAPPRIRRWIEVANILIVMGLLVYLLYYAVINVPLMHRRMLGALQIPKSYVHLAIPVGIALWLRTLAGQLWTRIRDDR